MNAYKKEELLDILVAADTSAVGHNYQALIDTISKLTAEFTSLKTSLNDHQESTHKQVDDWNQKKC